MEETTLTGYDLSRAWWDFCFENPDIICPNHSALYFFCIELCNRLGWKAKFGLPTTTTMEAIGIKSYKTYIKILNDLIEFGFIEMYQASKNQYTSNVIGLGTALVKNTKALDKAITMHMAKQVESDYKASYMHVQSNVSIDKQLNNKTNKQINQETNKEDSQVLLFVNEEEKERKEKSSAKKEKKVEVEIILPFNTDKFRETWNLWLEYRKDINKPYKSKKSEQAALMQLSDFDEEFSISLIKRSIANSYQGLVFESTKQDYLKYAATKNKQTGTNNQTSSVAEIYRMYAGSSNQERA